MTARRYASWPCCASALRPPPAMRRRARSQVSFCAAISPSRWRAGERPPSISGKRSSAAIITPSSCNRRPSARARCWLEGIGEAREASACREAAREIEAQLRDFWSDDQGFTRSRIGASGEKDLDIATLLAVIHAGRLEGAHSVRDPKTFATAARLEDLFGRLYKINEAAPEGRAPAMGRYADDRYYSGGAYYFSTLGAAEFYYRAATARRRASPLHDADHAISFDVLFGAGTCSWRPSPPLRRRTAISPSNSTARPARRPRRKISPGAMRLSSPPAPAAQRRSAQEERRHDRQA